MCWHHAESLSNGTGDEYGFDPVKGLCPANASDATETSKGGCHTHRALPAPHGPWAEGPGGKLELLLRHNEVPCLGPGEPASHGPQAPQPALSGGASQEPELDRGAQGDQRKIFLPTRGASALFFPHLDAVLEKMSAWCCVDLGTTQGDIANPPRREVVRQSPLLPDVANLLQTPWEGWSQTLSKVSDVLRATV